MAAFARMGTIGNFVAPKRRFSPVRLLKIEEICGCLKRKFLQNRLWRYLKYPPEDCPKTKWPMLGNAARANSFLDSFMEVWGQFEIQRSCNGTVKRKESPDAKIWRLLW